jgi:hypothetical protein
VPTAQWFRFKVDVCDERAAISVDGQSPLVVERLAHLPAAGAAGLWTFRPAYFCDLRVSACDGLDVPQGEMPTYPGDAVTAWFAEGYGVVKCEPNGSLNLNRYLPASMGSVRLNRRFEMPTAGEVAFELGYSDAISLKLGEHEIFAGEYTFKGFADGMSRGYVEMKEMLRQTVEAGSHCLSAELRTSEFFGWGLVLAAHAPGLRWLPAELG